MIVSGDVILHHFGTLWISFRLLVFVCSILTSKVTLGGAPQRFRKPAWTKSCKKHDPHQAKGFKMGHRNRKVFCIFDDVFVAFPASFWGWEGCQHVFTNRFYNWHKSIRQLASKKVASEEAQLPGRIPGWGQERGKGGGKPPPWGIGGSEERKQRRKEEEK